MDLGKAISLDIEAFMLIIVLLYVVIGSTFLVFVRNVYRIIRSLRFNSNCISTGFLEKRIGIGEFVICVFSGITNLAILIFVVLFGFMSQAFVSVMPSVLVFTFVASCCVFLFNFSATKRHYDALTADLDSNIFNEIPTTDETPEVKPPATKNKDYTETGVLIYPLEDEEKPGEETEEKDNSSDNEDENEKPE